MISVIIPIPPRPVSAGDISTWIKENCSSHVVRGDYVVQHSIEYLFKNMEDAIAFKLRWS